jgi:SH3-like domain-containing protein
MRILFALLSALALSAPLLPTPAQADLVVPGEEHCVVNIPTTDALNLRERPGVGSRILTTLRYAQCGIIVTENCRGNWCPAEEGHYAGYAHRNYLAMVSPAMYCVTGVAGWDKLNLRAYPSASSRILARLEPNQCDIAFLPYAVGNWQKVRVDGWEGWVARRYVSGQ